MDGRGRSETCRRSVVAALLLVLGGCTASQATSAPIVTSGPSATASVNGSSAPASAQPSAPEPGFDATNIAITLTPFAKVTGGPLAITDLPDGSGRLFVATQDGHIWIIANGAVEPTPLLDIGARITTGGERGLLGIAVHPHFPTDPRVFVDYTDLSGNTVVSSFTIDPSNANRLDPSSEKIVFTTAQPFPNHNGGALLFGPDGDLYISLGDGGSEGDPLGNGQKKDTTLAKILRIDIDHSSGGRPYAIPPGNPFAGDPLARPEIWLYGLRNPWRMSFDRATGNLWIGDVGQDRWEEIDVAPKGVGGLNFGWKVTEGAHCYDPSTGCDTSGITMPVAEYGHDQGCAVMGGYVYRGTASPALRGGYLFADYCSGTIFAIPATATGTTTPVVVGKASSGVSAFGEDAAGELYLANLDGTIDRIIATTR